MKDILQKQFKSLLEQADNIEKDVKAAGRDPNETEMKQYNELLAQAEQVKNQIDAASKREKFEAFAKEPDGRSVVKASFDRMAMDGEGEIPGVTADAKTGEMYAIDGAYKSIGEENIAKLKAGAYKDAFAELIRAKGRGRQPAEKYMKVLSEASFGSGEAWLPPDFRAELIKKMATMTSVRPNASVYTTGTDKITFPSVNYATDDKYTSGVRFTWRGSATQTSDISEATNPVAGNVTLPVHLATAAIILTREQVEDNSFDILGYISELGAEAFSLGEEDAFTNGDGASKPWGFSQHPTFAIANGSTSTIAGVTYSGGYNLSSDSVGGMNWEGIIATEKNLPPQYEAGAKWYGNKATYSAIRSINVASSVLPQWSLGESYPNYANGMAASLLGYGIVKNQFLADVAAGATPLYLGDMKGYFIADRVGLSVEVFREVYGLRDQVVVYMRKRTGGQLVHYWRMKSFLCGS